MSAHSSGGKDQRKILFPSKLFPQFFPGAVREALPPTPSGTGYRAQHPQHSQQLFLSVISLHLLPAADTQERGTKLILQGENGKEYLANHVKGAPSPSSPNSLEIKALITLCLSIIK